MKRIIIGLSIIFFHYSAYPLGDSSILPASTDALTGTARSINQLTPEEIEKERIGPQEMQEKIYQEDLKREKEREEKLRRKESQSPTSDGPI